VTPRSKRSGQSLLETALLLPLLLILLMGGYRAYRFLELSGAAESAVHTHMLRTGRHLPSIEEGLSRTILPSPSLIRIRGENRSLGIQVPPFRNLTGKTVASANVTLPKEPAGGFLDLPSPDVHRESQGAVDCWGMGTPAGSSARRIIGGIVLAGAFR